MTVSFKPNFRHIAYYG